MLVSIIIPCLNEKDHIGGCLASLVANRFQGFDIEVLVIDGISSDGTREIVGDYQARFPFIRLLDNEKRIVSTAMNTGIKESRGEVIMRMDAHCTYANDYIAKCVEWLKKGDFDNVGGIGVTLPGGSSSKARTIAIALSSPFGVGNALHRLGVKEPVAVDTVPLGTFWRSLFEKIGLYDEELVRNQDDELNLRIVKGGGKILLVPDIVIYYYTRENYGQLWRMFFQYGYWKTKVLQKHRRLTLRAFIPPLFIISIILTLGLAFLPYIFTNCAISLRLSIRNHDCRLFPYMVLSFTTMHLSYGLGFLRGLIDFVLLDRKKSFEEISR